MKNANSRFWQKGHCHHRALSLSREWLLTKVVSSIDNYKPMKICDDDATRSLQEVTCSIYRVPSKWVERPTFMARAAEMLH